MGELALARGRDVADAAGARDGDHGQRLEGVAQRLGAPRRMVRHITGSRVSESSWRRGPAQAFVGS